MGSKFQYFSSSVELPNSVKLANEANSLVNWWLDASFKNVNDNTKKYLDIAIKLALAPLFMVALIPALLTDSLWNISTIFDLSWSNIMSLREIVDEIPEGIKKIAITLGLAVAAVTFVNLITGSVFAVLYALKLVIVLAAVTQVGIIIKENMHNLRTIAETVQEKISDFLSRCSSKVSSFLNAFTFRAIRANGGPVVQSDQSATTPPVKYDYFPNMPSYTDVYNSLPNNPFAGMFSRTAAQASSLASRVASNSGLVPSSEDSSTPPAVPGGASNPRFSS